VAHLTDHPDYDPVKAADFRKRSCEAHQVRWRADVVRWSGGVEHVLYEHLPILGGTLSLDASDPTRRHLTLEIAGVGRLVPDQPSDPLACFGQVVKLWMTIDRAGGATQEGGGFFPWIKMGEYPIQTTTSEWPSLQQTIECTDYSTVVGDFLHTKKKSYSQRSVYTAIQQITEAALPDKAFSIHSQDGAKSVQVEPHTIADAGSDRWETAVNLAAARGFETFFDRNGNLVIRDDVTNDDNDTIPGVGPDIGTVSNPVATIRDGERGNLVGLTQSVTREGGCNGVFINLHETASQTLRRQGRPVAGDKRVNVQVQALGTGPILWGDRYGRQPIVVERPVKVITDDVVAAQTRRAKRMLHRRGGVVRTLDLDAVGLYWLEPDDRVRIQYAGRTEAHFVASIEFDISGQSPARVRTRSLAVSDPG
jgi:hypothetical protein